MFVTKRIKNPRVKNAVEWALSILLAVLAYLVLTRFVMLSATVFGDSMEPTLSHNDRLFTNRTSYLIANPDYNDIIVFPYPMNPSKYYVKRVIGLPGDVVELLDHQFYVNDKIVEDTSGDGLIYNLGNIDFPVTVPENAYFVLGDNRNASEDSRFAEVGFVKREAIVGKAIFRFFPFNKIGFIK